MRLKITQSLDSYNNHANFNEIGLLAYEDKNSPSHSEFGKIKMKN